MSFSTTWLQKISSLLYKQKSAKHFWLTLTTHSVRLSVFFRFRFCLPFSNSLLKIFYFLWPSFYCSFLCIFESGFCFHNARMEELKRASFMWRRLNKTEKPFSVQGCARAFLMTKCLMTVWADTLESGIDVGQGINVGPGKFAK